MAKRIKVLFKIIVVLLLLLLILFFGGYYVFETYRLRNETVIPFADWRSYVSFLMSKIPYVKRFVEYEPMRLLPPGEYFEDDFKAYEMRLKKMMEEIEIRRKEIEESMKKIESEREKLERLKMEVEKERADLEREKREWRDRKKRLEKMAEWISASEPSKIVSALSSDNVSVELIADVLRFLSNDTAAEILQALSEINPEKAASVVALIGKGEDER